MACSRHTVSKISKIELPCEGNQLEHCLRAASSEETSFNTSVLNKKPESPTRGNRLILSFCLRPKTTVHAKKSKSPSKITWTCSSTRGRSRLRAVLLLSCTIPRFHLCGSGCSELQLAQHLERPTGNLQPEGWWNSPLLLCAQHQNLQGERSAEREKTRAHYSDGRKAEGREWSRQPL